MANIFTDTWARLKIDYQEYRNYLTSIWNVRRDNKAIRRAMRRAKEKNFNDGRTYYIMRDRFGGINELNSAQLLYFTRHGLFTKEQYDKRFEHAIAIVTSSKRIREQYNQAQLKTEDYE